MAFSPLKLLSSFCTRMSWTFFIFYFILRSLHFCFPFFILFISSPIFWQAPRQVGRVSLHSSRRLRHTGFAHQPPYIGIERETREGIRKVVTSCTCTSSKKTLLSASLPSTPVMALTSAGIRKILFQPESPRPVMQQGMRIASRYVENSISTYTDAKPLRSDRVWTSIRLEPSCVFASDVVEHLWLPSRKSNQTRFL